MVSREVTRSDVCFIKITLKPCDVLERGVGGNRRHPLEWGGSWEALQQSGEGEMEDQTKVRAVGMERTR